MLAVKLMKRLLSDRALKHTRLREYTSMASIGWSCWFLPFFYYFHVLGASKTTYNLQHRHEFIYIHVYVKAHESFKLIEREKPATLPSEFFIPCMLQKHEFFWNTGKQHQTGLDWWSWLWNLDWPCTFRLPQSFWHWRSYVPH